MAQFLNYLLLEKKILAGLQNSQAIFIKCFWESCNLLFWGINLDLLHSSLIIFNKSNLRRTYISPSLFQYLRFGLLFGYHHLREVFWNSEEGHLPNEHHKMSAIGCNVLHGRCRGEDPAVGHLDICSGRITDWDSMVQAS